MQRLYPVLLQPLNGDIFDSSVDCLREELISASAIHPLLSSAMESGDTGCQMLQLVAPQLLARYLKASEPLGETRAIKPKAKVHPTLMRHATFYLRGIPCGK